VPKNKDVEALIALVAAADQGDIPSFEPVVLKELSPRRRKQLDSVLAVGNPAMAESSAKALKALEKVCVANNLGTPRPVKMDVAIDGNKSHMYFMPATEAISPNGLNVTYGDYGFQFNLYKIFGSLERLVPPDIREIYALQVTETPIKIGERIGKAVFINLDEPTREPVHSLPEDEKAQRRATRDANKKGANTDQSADDN
jgi:hypothetical protein